MMKLHYVLRILFFLSIVYFLSGVVVILYQAVMYYLYGFVPREDLPVWFPRLTLNTVQVPHT